MVFSITTSVITGIAPRLIDPWRWKISIEELVIYFPLTMMIMLCLVIFIAMMFQWMVKKLIYAFVYVVAWLVCLPPRAVYHGVMMRTEAVSV